MFFMGKSKMISIFGEGRLIDAEASYPWGYEQKYYVRNVGIITNNTKSMLVETPFIDDIIHYSICERNGEKLCCLGATLTYRLRCYGDMESVKVINAPTVEMTEFDGDYTKCLPHLRKELKKKTDKYDRCLFYYYDICPYPGAPVRNLRMHLNISRKCIM